jgi:hypothetical protein
VAIKMATRNPSAKFISRHGQNGMCGHCGRDLGMTYLLSIDGEDVIMGRRCAARTLGWATTAVEMEAIRVERMTELNRRRTIIATAFPIFDGIFAKHDEAMQNMHLDPSAAQNTGILVNLLCTASNEDHFWDPSRPNYGRYGTWTDYLTRHLN